MRHQALGYPRTAQTAAGRSCGAWLRLFAWSHEPAPGGWSRREWPDGGPLLAQPWPQVMAFAVIRDELNNAAEQRGTSGSRGCAARPPGRLPGQLSGA